METDKTKLLIAFCIIQITMIVSVIFLSYSITKKSSLDIACIERMYYDVENSTLMKPIIQKIQQYSGKDYKEVTLSEYIALYERYKPFSTYVVERVYEAYC